MSAKYFSLVVTLIFTTALKSQVSFISGVKEHSVFVNVSAESQGLMVKLLDADRKALKTKDVSQNKTWGYELVKFESLQKGTAYIIHIVDNDNTILSELKFTTLNFNETKNMSYSFAAGSCSYLNDSTADRPGVPYGGGYKIFNAIAEEKPEFMLWLGDNTYLRNNEWETTEGVRYRYRHDRSVPQLQELLVTCPQYAIWDDHDYGPNDQDSTYKNAEITRAAFKASWGNQAYASPEGMGKFSYPGVDFFLLDDRSHRAPNDLEDTTKAYFGKTQLNWLLDELEKSEAKFKIIATGGQVLNTDRVYENYSNYAVERRWLLNELSKRNIKNLVFLTGDRHRSEVSRLKLESGFMVYDFTISPLTSKTYRSEETNTLLVEGSEIAEKNYAMITFTEKENQASLKVKFHDTEGKLLKEYELKPE